jgi:hypothetical protein
LACHTQEAQWENARQEAAGAIGQEKADEVPLRHGGKFSKTESLNGPMLGRRTEPVPVRRGRK